MRRAIGFVLVLSTFLFSASWPGAAPARAQAAGDRVLLVERGRRIPGHPEPGDRSISHRFPGGIAVTITEVDSPTGWLHVRDDEGNAAWITRTYVGRPVTAETAPGGLCYLVGTWNLEHFNQKKTRGFPENGMGGPTYPARSPEDVAAIARAIRDTLKLRVLILNEIMGKERTEDEGKPSYSEELDALVAHLGPAFDYIITRSGRTQRIALLYDRRYARLNAATEFAVPRTEVEGDDIFARDPLLGHFTFLRDGQPMNDLLVVGLHLASGQSKAKNHDAAMKLLMQKLDEERARGLVLPRNEHDILIGGDLNASKYDKYKEAFFETLNTGDWAVLAGDDYPATRLAGSKKTGRFQLLPRSQIDYLIVTRKTGQRAGLLGEEISSAQASVHQELARGDWDDFRRVYSDHFPVSTCVGVIPDND